MGRISWRKKWQTTPVFLPGKSHEQRKSGRLQSIVVAVHSLSCPTLWDPVYCSPPVSSVQRISQERILKWVAISFFRGLQNSQTLPSPTPTAAAAVTSVVFDSVRPHRQQLTRLPQPWDSPGKNTGVGCHFLLQCMKVKSEIEVAQLFDSSRPRGLQPTRLLCPWDFPGKRTKY